jgi:hypothetical protein
VSKEKSQFENVVLSPAEGGVTKKNTGPGLPAGFSVGQNLEQEQSVLRSETVKSFVPSYQSGADRGAQEEKEKKARVEKEGMNYDLYLLIKEKLVGEFNKRIKEKNLLGETDIQGIYGILKRFPLNDSIKENPELYALNSKDLQFISNNLREFFPKIEEADYSFLGAFVNSFIHAYFNSVPEEERKDLKLFLPNTRGLDYIGTELSFGELEADSAEDLFGFQACGEAVLKAQKVGNRAGYLMCGEAKMEVVEAGYLFGEKAFGNAILNAQKVGNFAGLGMYGEAKMEIVEASDYFGHTASGNANLKVKKAGNSVGRKMQGKAKIVIVESYVSINEDRKDDSQVILPDGRILRAGDSA